MLKSDGVAVGTTPTELTVNVDVDGEYVLLIRPDFGSPEVQIGDSAVAYGAGLPLAAGVAFELRLQAGTRVYGVVQSGSKTVNVLAYSA